MQAQIDFTQVVITFLYCILIDTCLFESPGSAFVRHKNKRDSTAGNTVFEVKFPAAMREITVLCNNITHIYFVIRQNNMTYLIRADRHIVNYDLTADCRITTTRSEERRVEKESRTRRWPY